MCAPNRRIKRYSPIWESGVLRDKFEIDEWTGRSLFAADGPSQRYNIPRRFQDLTPTESAILGTFDTRTWREEQHTQNKLATLFSQGYKLDPNESAEEFIERCSDEI